MKCIVQYITKPIRSVITEKTVEIVNGAIFVFPSPLFLIWNNC